MITLRILRAQMGRVQVAPDAMRETLMLQLASMIDRRKRQRGPSKLARRLRRKQELGLAGVF